MKRSSTIIAALTLLTLITALPSFGEGQEWSIELEEKLGHSWKTDLVHRRITSERQGELFAGRAELLQNGKPVAMQLDNIEVFPNGSIRAVDVWFQSDLPANGSRHFTLRRREQLPVSTMDVQLPHDGNVLEVSKGPLAVRLPGGRWSRPAEATTRAETALALRKHLGELPHPMGSPDSIPGPLLGVRMPNGKWTAGSHLSGKESFEFEVPLIQPIPEIDPGLLAGYETEILADDHLFSRIRVTYTFDGGGRYAVTVTLRFGEPLVRVDETYHHAGSVAFDLGVNFKPSVGHHLGYRIQPGKGALPIDYAKPGLVALFLGWDGYFKRIAPALLFTGDPSGDCLGLVSTDSDWLPYPYNQALHVVTTDGGGFQAKASLTDGQRHWAFYVGKSEDFPTPDLDFYRWWYAHVVMSLDKIVNWQLDWPGMMDLEFPHTFFGRDELPDIRKRLQADPVIAGFVKKSKSVQKRSLNDAAPAALVDATSDDMAILKATFDKDNYIDSLPAAFLGDAGFYEHGYKNYMQITDELLKRYVGIELMLGSGLLAEKERRQCLRHLAFAMYLMDDTLYWPPNYPYSPQRPEPNPAYVQGTPNQKICYVTARGIVASMLSNHPLREKWMKRVMEEHERVVADSVAPSGAHLESPFYSSRDTMRFGPFWTAVTRAGVSGPDVDRWLNRLKNCYLYMSDMLTVPEPRMNGRRVYHPIGRSSPGVIDPTMMVAAEPFGQGDEAFLRRMKWCWEQQGRPGPDITGTTGGRDMSLTLLAFSKISSLAPSETPPLKSVRWEGMGAILRSQVGSGFESNVVFRHDPFSWNLYEGNNGAVYFYGKGAPLLPRFGGYWMAQQGQPNLMSIPFGNRIIFEKGESAPWTDALGNMTQFASLGQIADFASGTTRDGHWRRDVLFSKDLDKEDPVYLLVRDDVNRPGSTSALHWWVMSKQVQPDGLEKPGVVPTKGNDKAWLANIGKNWKDAPKLSGPLHHFQGQCGVDLDMYIAAPAEPKIVTDAVGVGPGLSYCVNRKLYEYQQLIRIEQSSGKGYMTLFSPRWPGSPSPTYRTIADGNGVAISSAKSEDRLFLSANPISFKDETVTFNGTSGFSRVFGPSSVRLMIQNGKVTAGGITLGSASAAALVYNGSTIEVVTTGAADDVRVVVSPAIKSTEIRFHRADSSPSRAKEK